MQDIPRFYKNKFTVSSLFSYLNNVKLNCFFRAIRPFRQVLQIRVCYYNSGFQVLFAYDLLSFFAIKKPAEFFIQSAEKVVDIQLFLSAFFEFVRD